MQLIPADFSIIDDLLREAARGHLAERGAIRLEKSRRIGPLIELAFASASYPEQYRSISTDSPYSTCLREAMRTRRAFGGAYADTTGAFPLEQENPVTSARPDWDQWTTHAENVAKAHGHNPHLIAGLLGALVELQDNIYEHSGAPATGLVAYASTSSSFEFVVADTGIGVLDSLRQNPKYSCVDDAGAALKLAISDGISRFPSEAGRGQGFGQLFRALVGHNAELRFRSGDHTLTLRPGGNLIAGSVLAQVAPLNGLAVSVFCAAAGQP